MTAEKKEGAPERLAIPIGDRLKAVIGIAYRARRPVLLEGPTGIGKSDIIREVAAELGIERIVLDLSLLEPPDLVGLPVMSEGRTTYAPPGILPVGGAGILMLEELNRAERYIQQPALQLLTERKLHEYELPDGWSTCAAVNPERGEYQVTPLDPALRSRFLNLLVHADRECWLAWAETHQVHGAVLRLARSHDRLLEDVPPRTWTYVSDVLNVAHPDELCNETLLHDLLSGYLPPAWMQVLCDTLDGWAGELGLETDRLLATYHDTPALQAKLATFREQGRTDVLNHVAHRVLAVVGGPELGRLIGRKEFQLLAFEKLVSDLPGDWREDLQAGFGANPMAAAALDLEARQVVRGYSGSAAAQQVRQWAAQPELRHRVLALVTGLCAHLKDARRRKPAVCRDMGVKASLGQFIEDVGPAAAGPLTRLLPELGITPLGARPPKGGRR
ncbi:MAG: AAA family ATPase [Kiritimatiellae bacterium]|nr:AAA family ATPase [Kiritimatiellia bacterium]